MQPSHVSMLEFVAFVLPTSLTSLIKSSVLGMTFLPSYYPFTRFFSPQNINAQGQETTLQNQANME